MVQPVLKELESLEEVRDVAAQWLEAGVGALGPELWHLPDEERVREAL